MRTLQDWLSEYSESHQNPINKKIHWLCVPVIVWTLMGMSYHVHVLLTVAMMAVMLLFYVRLSLKLTLGIAVFLSILLAVTWALPVGFGFYAGLFVLAWIGQFYGHKEEGKKPSFFKDVQFLLIGPAWVADALMKKLQVKHHPVSPV